MYTQCLCSSQLTMQLRQAKQVWDEPCYAREAKRRLSNVSYIKNFCKGYMKYIPNCYLILTGPTKAGVVLWLCCARETNRKSSTINQLSVPHATTTTKYRTPTLTLVVPVIYPSSSVVLPITQLYSV